MNDFEIGEKLRECLTQLIKGKATERKKQAGEIKKYLSQESYINYLNRSSLRKKNGLHHGNVCITWKIVFSKIKEYIEQECQKCKEREQSSQNLSAIVKTNLMKEKRSCLDLFRSYMKAIYNSQQYDMTQFVMSHILAVLHSSYTRVAFGLEYFLILSRYILSNPLMYMNVPEKDIDDAIWFYCKSIKNPSTGWDRGMTTHVFLNLLTAKTNLGALETDKILEIFTHSFEELKYEKASSYHENLLKSMLHVCKSLGADYRLCLCKLGESIILSLLQIWKTRPSELCCELMLEFISFQMVIHHPKGAVGEVKGARAYDWSAWKSILVNLYKVIVMEIIELCEKNKYSTSKETILKPIFVSVAVEVFAQVLVDSVGVLDVTQFPSTHDGSLPSKKRRIEVCFRTFTDYLSSPKIVPWLQVIAAFIVKYPDNISLTDADHLLDTLMDINLSCNQFETKNWLLNCFSSFVQAFGNKTNTGSCDPLFNWQKLWDLGVKSVALMHQCQDAGHNLLVTLLSHKLVTPKAEFHNLYTPGSSNRVTKASLRTLITFLEKCQSTSPIKNGPPENSSDSFTFENQLIEWLFSRKPDDISPSQLLSGNTEELATEEFAHLITLLCVKNISLKQNYECETIESSQWITDLEKTMLQITFDLPTVDDKDENKNTKPLNLNQSASCSQLWEKILNMFIDVSSNMYEEQSRSQTSDSSVLIRHGCLMFDILQVSYMEGIVTEQDLNSNVFISYLKQSLNVAYEIEMKKEDKSSKAKAVSLFTGLIDHVCSVFEKHFKHYGQNPTLHRLVTAVSGAISSDVLKLLLNFCFENVNIEVGTSSSNVFGPSSSVRKTQRKNRYAAFDDEDMDIDNESFAVDSVDKEDFEDMMNSNDKSTENFQEKLKCLKVLGKYCSFVTSEELINNRPNVFTDFMKTKLASVITSQVQSIKGMNDVNLVLVASECMLSYRHLSDSDISCVIGGIKVLLNQFNTMQDLCISVLELFQLMMPHLFQTGQSSSTIMQHRSHMLHLLHILSKKELQRKGSPHTSYLIAKNIFSILKVDPSVCWPNSGDNLEDKVFITLNKILSSPFTSARLYAATNMHTVITPELVESIFISNCSEILEFLYPANPVELDPDRDLNRISTFFHYIECVILHFPCLAKEALYILCKVIKNKLVNPPLAVKVLSQLSSYLGYESVKSFVELHLKDIFNKWVQAKQDMVEFPFVILEAKSIEDFFKEYSKIVVPVLFFLEDLSSITKITQMLHMTDSDIVYSCFPTIEAQILARNAVPSQRKNAEKFRALLSSFIPKEVQAKAFKGKIDEFIISLLSLLKEDRNFHLESCKSFIDHSITFDELSSIISEIGIDKGLNESFVSFLSQKADCIQKIFLSLSVMLSKALTPHDGSCVLYMYQCFLNIITPELSPNLSCSRYIIKEVVYSIINFLVSDRKNPVKYSVCITECCDILQSLCSKAVMCFKEVIGEFLPFAISNLVQFVEESESGKRVLSFFEFLIDDCQESLVDYIPYLDPFPDNVLFEKLALKRSSVKYKGGLLSLEQEIKQFLKSCKMIGKATEEGLSHLFKQLSSRREELLNILNILKEKTLFSEDVKDSIFHQLICLLASICASEKYSMKVKNSAAACLGAIGPISLSSVVLQPSAENDNKCLNSVQKSLGVIFNTLTDYLFDNRIDIKVTTSEMMHELFGTKIAHTFFTSYKTLSPDSSLQRFATPFYDCQDLNLLQTTCQFNIRLDDIQDLSLWLPEEDKHSEWITRLVCTLIESGVARNNLYECLVPLCKKEVLFCEKILPFLIHSILLYEDSQVDNVISTGVDLFFSNFSSWRQTSTQRNGNSSPILHTKFSKASVHTMLSVIHYLWLNPKQDAKPHKNIWKNSWLKVSYLEIAQAAQFCSAYFTAVLYTELWCDFMKEKSRETEAVDQSDSSGSLECTPLSFIGSHGRDKAHLVYDILLDTYTQIGDFDAISGCEVVAMDSQAILKHSYLTENKWDGLLKISDMNQSSLEILQALQQSNLNSVLQGFIQSLRPDQDKTDVQFREYQCESAWRLGQWNMHIPESSTQGFQELLFKCQQSVVAENSFMFQKFNQEAKQTQFEYLKHISLETSRNIQSVLSKIQMLSVLNDFYKLQANPLELQDVLKTWNLQDQMPYDDYMFVEPVCWLKCILLKHQVDVNSNKQLMARGTLVAELKKLLERHARKARNELHLEVASNAMHVLHKLPYKGEADVLCWQVEESKILWTKKEFSIANKILKSALNRMEKYSKENPTSLLHYGQALTLRGRWLAETCNENSGVIMRDYLEKALGVLQKLDHNTNEDVASAVSDAHLAVAQYADSQYQSIVNYKKSTAYQTKQDLVNNATEEAKQLQSKAVSDDQRKLHLTLIRQRDIDIEEMKSIEDDRKQFLEKAVINYLQCLRGSNTHDLWVFRLISLWFQNLDVEEINKIIKSQIHNLQTYKFLPLMYQLAARMGSQASGSFTQTLMNLIQNIALQHPHHALPVILALSNADKDPVNKVGAKEKSKQTAFLQQAEVPAVKERMNAAKNMISILQKTKISSILNSYSDLCDAYISLAYLHVDKSVKKGTIPKQQAILKFKNLQNIPIITEDLKVDRSCEYRNFVGIHSFNSEFRMCGGITLPKVIKCIGTDGIGREQLVKGCDDLRQDAVMQQVFCLVNCLLKQKRETRRRKLHIRTYKVVPVSRRSGVLQWCEGTQVVSEYLIGTKTTEGAHVRYYPNMSSPLECRKKMMGIASVSQIPKKRQIFDSICSNFPPVFRYFFLENFPEPCAWFERRQSYTKSVAASSIVGYILGLGDRHVNNILIDKNTAEVVHIDFGIAFEKGRILATPETVPFRLTRDIVDGMGINGVEGIFKRCSEKTLEVMRESQDVLLTILEVLLHDPLYEWTVPANKSQKATGPSNSQNGKESNTLAERALMRLQQKLQGLEEGVALSIEGQVNLLVQQARDPNNLCRIYAGWQPYL